MRDEACTMSRVRRRSRGERRKPEREWEAI